MSHHYVVQMGDGAQITVIAADEQDAKARASDLRMSALRVTYPMLRQPNSHAITVAARRIDR